MRIFLAVATVAVASANFCSIMLADLPQGGGVSCTCTNATDGFTLNCVGGPSAASVNATYDFKPCANPATTGYSAVATIGTTKYPLAQQSLTAGETKNVPIPDATVGGTGLFMATTVKGNIAAFDLDLALALCDGTTADQKCNGDMSEPAGAAATTAGFPFTILKKTFDFSGACSPASVLSPSGLSMIASAIFALMHIWH